MYDLVVVLILVSTLVVVGATTVPDGSTAVAVDDRTAATSFLLRRRRSAQEQLRPNNQRSYRRLSSQNEPVMDDVFMQLCFAKVGLLLYVATDDETVAQIEDAPTLVGMFPSTNAFTAFEGQLSHDIKSLPWSAHLEDVINMHLLQSQVGLVQTQQAVTMANGAELVIEVDATTSRFRVGDSLAVGYLVGSTGYAYVMDEVLSPSWMSQSLWNVVDTSFHAFKNMLIKAGMESELMQDSQTGWTIFAPDDNAINVYLDQDVFNQLDQDMALLQNTLRHHIVPNGPYPSMHFSSSALQTMYGDTLNLVVGSNSVKVEGIINEATITSFDYLTYNGLIHGIDRFLLLDSPSAEAYLDSCPPNDQECVQWLTAHNIRRQSLFEQYNMEPVLLEWDTTVAAHAQSWVNQLQSVQSDGCAFAHGNPSQFGEGENLYAVWGRPNGFTPEQVLVRWWDNELVDLQNGVTSFSDIGHFTQAAWYGTTKIGCATYTNSDSKYGTCEVGVCRYWKAGNCNLNIDGDILGQVLQGTTCT
jgi:uncharacterized surface protein with fasciclin (FAS1) repeats